MCPRLPMLDVRPGHLYALPLIPERSSLGVIRPDSECLMVGFKGC